MIDIYFCLQHFNNLHGLNMICVFFSHPLEIVLNVYRTLRIKIINRLNALQRKKWVQSIDYTHFYAR